MKMSKRFKAARKKLKSGSASYICDALRLANVDQDTKARELVMQRLAPHVSYTIWASYEHPEFYQQHFNPRSIGVNAYENMRAARIHWLDQLIAEFKAKGD